MTDHADTIRRALQTVVDEFGPNVTDTPDIWDDAFAAVDALVAERQQAMDRTEELESELAQWRDSIATEALKARCEQAIDALREIAAPSMRDVAMDDRAKIARAALLSLGEQP